MFCPSCKHENRAGRKFCVRCGAGLELTCPSCGASEYARASLFTTERITSAVAEALRRYEVPGGIEFPVEAHVLLARA